PDYRTLILFPQRPAVFNAYDTIVSLIMAACRPAYWPEIAVGTYCPFIITVFVSMATPSRSRVLVTGGGTFLGDYIAAALVAEGADVTLLVRPGAEDRLGGLAERVRWATADVWDAASLRGRARGHQCVVHTVGSLIADPAQGLTHHRLNFMSARNVVNMCSSDGVPTCVLMSTVRAPWLNRQYVAAKREAEEYVRRVGVNAVVVRAPLVYRRGSSRPLFYRLVSALRLIPP